MSDCLQICCSRLVTSYAVSPRAVLSCAPCSIRCHSSKRTAAQRYTYCSVSLSRPRILGFAEDCPKGGTPGKISTFSVDVKIPSRIIYLDIVQLPKRNDGTPLKFKILAIHENAQVTYYEHDLQKEELTEETLRLSRSREQEQETIQVHYATCFSIEQARKGILKARDDLLASLCEPPPVACLLLLLTTTKHSQGSANPKLTVKLCNLHISHKILNTQLKSRELLSQDISPPQMLQQNQHKFSYHTASATFYQQTINGVCIYDLSQPTPRPKHVLQLDHGKMDSFLRISACLLATTTAHSISLIALPYCSLQGSKNISTKNTQANGLISQKAPEDSSTGAELRLLSYSVQHQTLIALDGRRLIATSILETPLRTNPKKRKRNGLLISSLGRGSTSQLIDPQGFSKSASKILGRPLNQSNDYFSEGSHIKELDDILRQGSTETFDEAIISELGNDKITYSHTNHQQISYILTKMFKLTPVEARKDLDHRDCQSLRVSLWPRKTSQWLLTHGLLTISRIETALKQKGTLPITSKLAHGALISALAAHDPSLDLLSVALASSIPLSSTDLAYALAIVTRWGVDNEANSSRKLLTNGEPSNNDERNGMPVVHGGLRSQNQESIRQILGLTLKKLYGYPSAAVTLALRDAFTTLELHLLVDLLRMEIASNGWLSLYEDDISTAKLESISNDELTLVSHILNSILDALGPAGWMLGSSAVDVLTESADVISFMKAEVSAALEGVEEVIYLKGMLGEILLCGKESLIPPSKKAVTSAGGQNASLQHAQPKTVALRDERSEILPLGLKLKPALSMTKAGAGGELRTRSRRDIGQLKSKMVGKYSFEKIII